MTLEVVFVVRFIQTFVHVVFVFDSQSVAFVFDELNCTIRKQQTAVWVGGETNRMHSSFTNLHLNNGIALLL